MLICDLPQQEGIGLDILVHGEAERTDMVEFFGQKLDGMAFTQSKFTYLHIIRALRSCSQSHTPRFLVISHQICSLLQLDAL